MRVVGGEQCRFFWRVGVLDRCAVVGMDVGVRGVLRSGGWECIESCEVTIDVPKHVYVYVSVGVVPF